MALRSNVASCNAFAQNPIRIERSRCPAYKSTGMQKKRTIAMNRYRHRYVNLIVVWVSF